jgi:hypothetical protein
MDEDERQIDKLGAAATEDIHLHTEAPKQAVLDPELRRKSIQEGWNTEQR